VINALAYTGGGVTIMLKAENEGDAFHAAWYGLRAQCWKHVPDGMEPK